MLLFSVSLFFSCMLRGYEVVLGDGSEGVDVFVVTVGCVMGG